MAFSGSQITRLGYYGGTRQRNGSFAGKTAAAGEAQRFRTTYWYRSYFASLLAWLGFAYGQ